MIPLPEHSVYGPQPREHVSTTAPAMFTIDVCRDSLDVEAQCAYGSEVHAAGKGVLAKLRDEMEAFAPAAIMGLCTAAGVFALVENVTLGQLVL